MGKRDKNSLKNKFAPELFTSLSKIEMSGNREIIIDGCKGIVEYGEDFIRLSLGECMLTIRGDSLVVASFDSSIAVISGMFCEISFTS